MKQDQGDLLLFAKFGCADESRAHSDTQSVRSDDMNQLTQRMVTWITWERVGLFIAGLALGLVLTSVIVSSLVPAYPRDAEVLTLQMDANSASGQFRSTSLTPAYPDSRRWWLNDTLKTDYPRICVQGDGRVTGTTR